MSDPIAVLVDGEPRSQVSVHDRGLQYGDGLFETLRLDNGRIRWFERHMSRLALGCRRLGLSMPDAGLLRAEVEALAAAQTLVAAQPLAIAKLILTRGTATGRGYRPRGDERVTRIISLHPWPAAPRGQFRVGLSGVPLGANRLLAGLKHLNRLEQVLAQQDPAAARVDEVLMATQTGEVVCGSASNLFVACEDRLLTPPVTECGVAGVMRSLVIDAAAQLGIALYITPVLAAQLDTARGLFVTNIRLGVQAVHWYGDRRLAPDSRGDRLQEWIDGRLD